MLQRHCTAGGVVDLENCRNGRDDLSYKKKNYIARRQPSCSFPSCFVHLTLEMQKSFLPSPIFRSRPTPFFLFSCSACSPSTHYFLPSFVFWNGGEKTREADQKINMKCSTPEGSQQIRLIVRCRTYSLA